MRITEINIISFGRLEDLTLTLDDGLNVIFGGNESGKSTLLAFIKFVLYGVGRKEKNTPVGERERAISWRSGYAAGSLCVVDTDDKKYRIERSGREGARGTYVDKSRIIDLSDGNEVFEGEVPGEHFLGIGAQAYDSTCSIRQLECVALNKNALREVIDNMLSSGDENTSVSAAQKLLEAERRRLLHANAKGGAIYDSELRLSHLKSEYKGAVTSENERIKNRDELSKVEISLKKASDEHALAQKMCDIHDDVIRLEKFERLRAERSESETLKGRRASLDSDAGFDVSLASHAEAAEIKSTIDALERSRQTQIRASEELEKADAAMKNAEVEMPEGECAEVISEHSTIEGVVEYVRAKRSKRSNSSFFAVALGAAGGALFVFALMLAVLMNNISGAFTVAFIAAIFAALAVKMKRDADRAAYEISDICRRIGVDEIADENEIRSVLTEFQRNGDQHSRYSNAVESAKFRLSMADEAVESDRTKALSLISRFCAGTEVNDEAETLRSLLDKINAYLSASERLDAEIGENRAVITSLTDELARFDERAIRARVTSEMEEKIKNIPFDELKAQRDQALLQTNRLNQYKAGIERSLAADTRHRSPSEIFPEIEAEEEELRLMRLRLDAVKLAYDTIESASKSIKGSVTPKIKDSTEKNLSAITSGKYGELYIDSDMNLTYLSDGEIRNISSLSRGSLDAAYFSLRLALIGTLLSEVKPPVYMDECLSQLDDARARGLLCALSDRIKNGSQCLLLTCQSRDVRLVGEMFPEARVIELA